MNKLQRIERKHIRGLKRLGNKTKYSILKRLVRTALEYRMCKEEQKLKRKQVL